MKNISKIFIACCLFAACNHSKKMTTENAKPLGGPVPFDQQGHRGCRGLMPENTIPAMLHAIDLGVNTLEMDIVFTKDGQAILSHEPFFNHEITTTPDGSFIEEKDEKNFNIYQMNYAEVKKYDVGLKPNPRFPQQEKIAAIKPTLSDLIDSVRKYMMNKRRSSPLSYNIETKTQPRTDNVYHPGPEVFVENLMAVINEKGISENVIIQSFDTRTLQYLHKKYPAIRTALLIDVTSKSSLRKQLKDLGFTPTIYSPEFSLINKNLINECHDQNIRVIPWTVNEKEKIKSLKKMGVDGVITDYPDLFE